MATDETRIFEQLTADEVQLYDAQVARMRELMPGWNPDEDEDDDLAIELLVARARARQDALHVDMTSDVLATLLAYVGEHAGITRVTAQPAVGLATVTTDGRGTYVLPAGASMVGYLPDQTPIVFMTVLDTLIEPGDVVDDDEIQPGQAVDVIVQAEQDGYAAGIGPQTLQPDQGYGWLQAVELTSLTQLGADGDTDDEHLERVAERLPLLGDVLVQPADMATYVESLDGIGRVLAIDLLDTTNPAAPVFPVERWTTLIATDAVTGGAPDSALIASAQADLNARVVAGQIVKVLPPTLLPVSVELTVAVFADALTTAGPLVEDAVRAWLSPAVFGARGYGYGDGGWQQTNHVRIGDVVAVADSVDYVDYVPPNLVLIGGLNGAGAANADYAMAGLSPLPDPSRTSVVVHVVERTP